MSPAVGAPVSERGHSRKAATALTSAAMKGSEKDESVYGTRGDFIELDPGHSARPLPAVRIDGPYGAPAEDVFGVEVAVLVGAGIGELCSFLGHALYSLLLS